MKRDARSSKSKDSANTTPSFKAGLTTGINCLHKLPLSAGPKKANTGFPKRKAFVIPSKLVL